MKFPRRWLLLTAFLSTLAGGQNPHAEGILQEYIDQLPLAEYSGREVFRERQTDGSLVRVVADVKRKRGKELTRYVRGPTPYRGVVLCDDGDKYWMYFPTENRAYQYPSRRNESDRRGQHLLENAKDRFDIELENDETVGGRRAHHIRLKAKDQGGVEFNLWIDTERKVALRFRFQQKHKIWRESQFTSVDFDNPPGDQDFRFAVPDGVQVIVMPPRGQRGRRPEPLRLRTPDDVRQRLNLRVMQPRRVPPGYRLDAQPYLVYPPRPGNVFRRRVAVVHVNEGKMILLSQGAAMPDPFHGRHDRGGDSPREVKPGVFFWVKNDVRLVLVGPRDVDRREMLACAESVDWYDAR